MNPSQERGIYAASTSVGGGALKRHECRAPNQFMVSTHVRRMKVFPTQIRRRTAQARGLGHLFKTPAKLPRYSADVPVRMARSLKPIDAGYAALVCDADSDAEECDLPVFDPADWRCELGSWATKPAAVNFDPAVCRINPEQLGFAPGWSSLKA